MDWGGDREGDEERDQDREEDHGKDQDREYIGEGLRIRFGFILEQGRGEGIGRTHEKDLSPPNRNRCLQTTIIPESDIQCEAIRSEQFEDGHFPWAYTTYEQYAQTSYEQKKTFAIHEQEFSELR